MDIRLGLAKNGSTTCKAQGRYLHSKYDPEREAAVFTEAILCEYTPSCIIVTGPSLSYCLPPLQKRFPALPLYAVQYSPFFIPELTPEASVLPPSCKKWTSSFLCDSLTSPESLCEEIFFQTGESLLFAALFVSWTAADLVYKAESEAAWTGLKLLLKKSRDVLATRSFYSQRWLKNTIYFFLRITQISAIQKGDKPILIAASGPSLASSLSFIKKNRNSFFILALSSALLPLVNAGIYPDLCMSTDGGFYARSHLYAILRLMQKNIKIPLALSPESAVPQAIFTSSPIIPLCYEDGIEASLFSYLRLPAVPALRNGTVSGTAVFFALNITTAAVYACGLDLAHTSGYTHTGPNALEQTDSLHDHRFAPLLMRTTKLEPNNALDLYRRWFTSQSALFDTRFFRLSATDFSYSNRLGTIKDLHWTDIQAALNAAADKKAPELLPVKQILQTKKERKKLLFDFLNDAEKKINAQQGCQRTDDYVQLWQEQIALAEYLAVKKFPAVPLYKQKLKEKTELIFTQLKDLCR